MSTMEERVSLLEAKLDEHSRGLTEVRQSVARLEERMEVRFDAVDARFRSIEGRLGSTDSRFDAVDHRFDAVDHRFDAVDRRFDAVDRRFDSIDNSLSRLVAIHLASMTAMVGALTGILYAVLLR